jgi:hypothetical protein
MLEKKFDRGIWRFLIGVCPLYRSRCIPNTNQIFISNRYQTPISLSRRDDSKTGLQSINSFLKIVFLLSRPVEHFNLLPLYGKKCSGQFEALLTNRYEASSVVRICIFRHKLVEIRCLDSVPILMSRKNISSAKPPTLKTLDVVILNHFNEDKSSFKQWLKRYVRHVYNTVPLMYRTENG